MNCCICDKELVETFICESCDNWLDKNYENNITKKEDIDSDYINHFDIF